jgi:hypothetical protein
MRKFLALTLLYTLLAITVFADSPPGGGCVPDEYTDCVENNEELPLDSQVFYLVGGGLIMGIIYFRRTAKDTFKI